MLSPTFDFVVFLKALENRTWAEIRVAIQDEMRATESALHQSSPKTKRLYEERGSDLIAYGHLLEELAGFIHAPLEPVPNHYKPVFQTTVGLPDRVKRMVNQVNIKERRQIPHKSPEGMERRRLV